MEKNKNNIIGNAIHIAMTANIDIATINKSIANSIMI